MSESHAGLYFCQPSHKVTAVYLIRTLTSRPINPDRSGVLPCGQTPMWHRREQRDITEHGAAVTVSNFLFQLL